MLPGVDTRGQILDAAASVIVREGATGLTLEKVAREAGVSKGGLLYHFCAKERLIEALIERMIGNFDDDLAAYKEQHDNGPGFRTRAFVRATLEGNWATKTGLRPHGVEMFAALVTDPGLLEPLRDRYASWQSELENDAIPPERATVARLAADGLWLAELLGLAQFETGRRAAIVREILSLTGQSREQKPKARGRRASA